MAGLGRDWRGREGGVGDGGKVGRAGKGLVREEREWGVGEARKFWLCREGRL